MTHLDSRPARVTVVRNAPDATLDAWARWLAADVRVVAAHTGEPLPALSDVGDAVIVLGGHVSAYDHESAPWLPALSGLLSELVAADVPVLGIGLGAQLLAVAGGGQVQVQAPPGREVGAVPVFWRSAALEDPLLGPVARGAEHGSSVVVSLHADAIVDLPPGGVWLASSNMYPFQAFRFGSAVGVQFRPEVSRRGVEEWCRAEALDPRAALTEYDAHVNEIERVGRRLAESFVEEARAAAVRRPARAGQ